MAIIDRLTSSTRWYRKLAWLIFLWISSVMALGVVASGFHLLMYAAGMRTH